MKPNELMIGDWVVYDGDTEYINPVKIDAIDITGMCVTSDRDDVGFEGVQPIPLTAEILEKNGFKKTLDADGMECYRYYNCAADGYIKITLHDGGDGDWCIEILNYDKINDYEIRYKNEFLFLNVHLLQHALRLCNIEKEIKL